MTMQYCVKGLIFADLKEAELYARVESDIERLHVVIMEKQADETQWRPGRVITPDS